MKKIRVAVGLSGGVDSSVAAYMLKNQGYEVIGLTMEIYDGSIKIDEPSRHACYGPGEVDDVRAASEMCAKMGIPYHTIDLKKEYMEQVIGYFRSEYLAGRTPNPCVKCNHTMKFGFMLQKAREAGIEFDYFATGHYARIEKENSGFLLKTAIDTKKDQTYFLYALKKQALSEILFPLGALKKTEVRKIALEAGLEAAEKAESQDFIACGNYSPLFENDKIQSGDITDESGKKLGIHNGIIHYTIGQRRGIGLSSGSPLYVIGIDAKKNSVVVGPKERLLSKEALVSSVNMLADGHFDFPLKAKAKIRQAHIPAECTVILSENKGLRVIFDEPQLSVTPGQSLVVYKDDIVVCGGIIESAEKQLS